MRFYQTTQIESYAFVGVSRNGLKRGLFFWGEIDGNSDQAVLLIPPNLLFHGNSKAKVMEVRNNCSARIIHTNVALV